MTDVHTTSNLPSKQAVAAITALKVIFDNSDLSTEQLERFQSALRENGFITAFNQQWMRNYGRDYLENPKLLENAPLSYLVALLNGVFQQAPEKWQDANRKGVLKHTLARLETFH